MSASLCPNPSNKSCPLNSWTRYSHSPVGLDASVFIRYIRCDGVDACMDPNGDYNWLMIFPMGKYNVITTSVPSAGIHTTNVPFQISDGLMQNLNIAENGLVTYTNMASNVKIMPVPVNIPDGDNTLYYGQPVHLMACIKNQCNFPLTVSNLNKSALPGGYLALIPSGSVGQHFKPAQFVLYPAGSQYHCNGTSCVKTNYGGKDLIPFDFSSEQTTMYSKPCPDFVCGRACNPSCVNGTCNTTTGKCECSSGYYGDSCKYKSCAVACKNKGTCDSSSGKCKCPPNTYGSECQYIQCSMLCENGSVCDNSTGKCRCHFGTYGDSCEFKECPGPCQNGGKCNPNTGKCMCASGFGGQVCNEIVMKPVLKHCHERCVNGVCDITRGVCNCHEGYYGKSCEYSFSCNTPLKPPTGGWEAAACDTDDDCLNISNCGVEGSCLMPRSGYCKSNGTCNFGLALGKSWLDCPK